MGRKLHQAGDSPPRNAEKRRIVSKLLAATFNLNPIEMMWCKVKASLRATEAHTHCELIVAVGRAFSRVISQDAINWYAAGGWSFI